MTVLTFPSNPQSGDTYSAPNGVLYTYDGVKWIAQTTTTTSQEITNFYQDSIAPLFTNIVSDNITFTYDQDTNVLSASVTAQANTGDFTFEVNNMRTPAGEAATITTYDGGEGYPRASLDLNPAGYNASLTAWWKSTAGWASQWGHWATAEWQAINETNGQLVFTGAPQLYEWFTRKYAYVDNLTMSVNGGPPITIQSGYSSSYPDSISLFTTGGFTLDPATITSIFIEYYPRAKIRVNGNGGGISLDGGEGDVAINSVLTSNVNGQYVNITSTAADTYGGVNITTKFDNSGLDKAWHFGSDGTLMLPYDGTLQTGQSRSRAISGSFNISAPHVIWSSSADWISSAKLLIQIECNEAQDDTGLHSQACEAIISSRGYSNGGNGVGEPQMTVYGVVHTSIGELATFTVQRNLTTRVFEVVATPTLTAAGTTAYYSVTSVEMTSWD